MCLYKYNLCANSKSTSIKGTIEAATSWIYLHITAVKPSCKVACF